MPSDLLRPVLQFAIAELRRASKRPVPTRPTIPAQLGPILKFTNLPDRALATTHDVIDTDPEFRRWLADRVNEADHGRAGVLFVRRPDGWHDDLDRLTAAWDEPIIETGTDDTKRLQRRLDVADRARERAEAERDEAVAELDGIRRQLDAVEAQRDELRARHDSAATELENVAAERRQAIAELKKTEEILAKHLSQKRQLETQIQAMTAAQLGQTTIAPTLDDATVRQLAATLRQALDDTMIIVDDLETRATPTIAPIPRRTPLPLPPGLLDDSVDVADYLLGVPGLTLLVDGYNVTKEAQPRLELDEQRRWLHERLVGLTARNPNVTATIVWDGADVGPHPTGNDKGVRNRFSPDGVEADDELIAMVERIDQRTPICVVSSDQRVRRGCAAGGANVVHSRQLIALCD